MTDDNAKKVKTVDGANVKTPRSILGGQVIKTPAKPTETGKEGK